MTDEPKTSRAELYIALAGPAVNLALCVLFLPFYLAGLHFFYNLIIINIALGIFNLIPAFPMDGGRVLRAILATRMSKHAATMKSLHISTVFAWIFIVAGGLMTSFNLLLIGGFLLFIIGRIKQQVR